VGYTNVIRWAWAASVVAGVVWLAVWAHQAVAHGTTQMNEKELVIGLTWMDSAKFLVVPFALLAFVVVSLRARRGQPGRAGRAGFAVTYAALALLVVGVALEFWSFPWGSYAEDFDEPVPRFGGLLQTLASLAFAVGTVLLAIDLRRGGVLPVWVGAVLVVGAVTTIYLTPVLPAPGVAWLALGAFLWRAGRDYALPAARASR
jgi:hypothetical protein